MHSSNHSCTNIPKAEKQFQIGKNDTFLTWFKLTAIDLNTDGTLFQVHVGDFNLVIMYQSLRLVSKNLIFHWHPDKIAFVSTGAALGLATQKTASWILVHYPAHVLFHTIAVSLLVAHLVSALALVHDLFRVSRRANKSLWVAIILTMPAVNFFLYRLCMRRYKPYVRRSYLY
ncbi:MAG: hypothetical protein DI538_06345 [Azospira oryzae]|nr:MAG: hypothetical protein DI538_06345 [Azospira oryzae]